MRTIGCPTIYKEGMWLQDRFLLPAFIEVHVVLEGAERIDVVNVDAQTELGEQFQDAPRAVSRRALTLSPGWFVAFLPEHAHHSRGWLDGPARVLKAVGKLSPELSVKLTEAVLSW